MKRVLSLMLLCSLVGLTACGDTATEENNGNNSSNNSGTNNTNQNNTSKDKSSFEVDSKQMGKDDEKVKGEVDNDKASKETSGAVIANGLLTLYLVAPNGTTIQAVVETTSSLQAPGSFGVTAPPDGTFVTWLAPVNGQILNSSGGSIVLTSCPTAVGQQVTGSFKDVTLLSELDGSTRTVNGDFDIVVYSKMGELNCKPKDTNTNNVNSNNKNNSNNQNMCTDYEVCDDTMGSCCPYAPCMAQCQLQCFQSDPACNDPFNADPVKCGQCVDACLDTCNVNDTCRNDYNALSACEDKAGCDALGDEDTYDTCVQGSCCAEVKAAF